MSKLSKMKEVVVKGIVKKFDQNGDMGEPVWFMEKTNGDYGVMITPFGGSLQKDAVVASLKELFKTQDICRYIFACEAWGVSFVGEEAIKEHEQRKRGGDHIPPSKHPNRYEIVLIAGEDRDTGESFFTQYKIDRTGSKPTLLVDDEGSKDYGEIGGRFVNMFEPPSTLKH